MVYFFVYFLVVILWFCSKSNIICMLDWVMDCISMCMVSIFLMLWFSVIVRNF